ncbi:MAG TPA: cytochrome P450 [Solirubrobacteraceae bacterium]|nr:cytochrome P450 [Solirubrobacteraceae bacterium]
MSALPPGPRYPAALQMVGFWSRPLAFLEQCRARYGRRFTIRLPLTPPFVMLTDPEDVKQVFTAPADVLHPGSGARVLEPVIGRHSVILLDEAAHMEQRKLMLPAFHGERVERLTDLVESVTEREVASWPSDQSVHLHGRLQQLTLEIILRAVFGLEPGPRMEALRDRLGAMLKFGEKPISLLPPTNPDGVPARVLQRVGPFATFVRVQREADTLIFGLIDERRRQADQQDDVLSLLLAATHEDGSPMSDQELRDELLTLLVAGHETTASTLAWGFDRLSGHPEVVDRLREDGDDYLGATIHEIMRRRPVIPNVAPRLVVEPIEVGGWSYPQGVCLVPNAYLIHHDPEIYPEPYEFRPERFLDKPPGTYTWIPFGGGRRRCLGASFAMLEMKVVLGAVLRQRDLMPVGTRFALPQRRNITVTPANGAEVRLPVRARVPAAAAVAG